jgi:hypothetical protein
MTHQELQHLGLGRTYRPAIEEYRRSPWELQLIAQRDILRDTLPGGIRTAIPVEPDEIQSQPASRRTKVFLGRWRLRNQHRIVERPEARLQIRRLGGPRDLAGSGLEVRGEQAIAVCREWIVLVDHQQPVAELTMQPRQVCCEALAMWATKALEHDQLHRGGERPEMRVKAGHGERHLRRRAISRDELLAILGRHWRRAPERRLQVDPLVGQERQ